MLTHEMLVAAGAPHTHVGALEGKGVPAGTILQWLVKYGPVIWSVVQSVIAANPGLSGNALVQAIQAAINAILGALPKPTPAPSPATGT